MRARNREINIFSISLLDILTGLLGAFLFLMLGLIPYYVKVSGGRSLSAEEQQKFEEMKKLVEKGLKGPLSEEEVKKLQDELDRLQKENLQLHGENEQLRTDLDQSRQDLKQAKQERDQAKQDLEQQKKDTKFWSNQDGVICLATSWDSPATDIDVFIVTPSGQIYGEKKENILGREVTKDGYDSHGKDWNLNDEGLLAYVTESGSYLVLYRIPKAAAPQSYSGLRGQFLYHQVVDKEKNTIRVVEGTLPYSYSASATPGGIYAWAVLNYDADKKTLLTGPLPSQLPPGVQPRPTPPATTPFEPFPNVGVSPTATPARGIGVTPTPSDERRALLEKLLRERRQTASPAQSTTPQPGGQSSTPLEDQRATIERLRRLREQAVSPTPRP